MWISTKYTLPDKSGDTFYLAKLTGSFMSSPGMYRNHPYDVVSGRYINTFPHLYDFWMPIPEKENSNDVS